MIKANDLDEINRLHTSYRNVVSELDLLDAGMKEAEEIFVEVRVGHYPVSTLTVGRDHNFLPAFRKAKVEQRDALAAQLRQKGVEVDAPD
ncbi:MAG: hypothetical protein AAGF32_03435 [Pseudomonadota bacterium]